MIEVVRGLLAQSSWSIEVKESPQIVRIQRTYDNGNDVILEIRQMSSGEFQIEESIEHRLSGPYNRCLPSCNNLSQMQDALLNEIEKLDADFES